MPVHKGCSWSACSALSPSGLDVQNLSAIFSVFGNGCKAAVKPQASLLLVPKTATLELIISFCAIAMLSERSHPSGGAWCVTWIFSGLLKVPATVLPHSCSSLLVSTRAHGHQGGWGGTASFPALPVFRVAISPCCWMFHGAVLCNWERTLGRWAEIPAQYPLQFSCAEIALFAWFTKMQKTCKIWCCLKIIYVQAQKEGDEIHWERAKLGNQAIPLRMKLNLDKQNRKHTERNDLSYKYTQMVPELAAVSYNKELDFAANSSQSAQRLGKQKHLAALRTRENYMFKIRACRYMLTYGSDFQSV